MTANRGSGIVEALFAAALGALATAILAASVFTGSRALALARGIGAQASATYDGLERLRRRAPGQNDDLVGTAPSLARRCERNAGRGHPDVLSVSGTWSTLGTGHTFIVDSRHLP
jgi:hypothetical protein